MKYVTIQWSCHHEDASLAVWALFSFFFFLSYLNQIVFLVFHPFFPGGSAMMYAMKSFRWRHCDYVRAVAIWERKAKLVNSVFFRGPLSFFPGAPRSFLLWLPNYFFKPFYPFLNSWVLYFTLNGCCCLTFFGSLFLLLLALLLYAVQNEMIPPW